jgi:ketosteroid isomerase-like protein
VPESGVSDLDRLKGLYEAWARGDFSRSGEIMDPAIESKQIGFPEAPGRMHSAEDLAAAMSQWLNAWERPFTAQAEEFVQSADRILVMVHWQARGKGSGIEMEADAAHLWTFRDGRAVRFDIYRDREEARAALRAE